VNIRIQHSEAVVIGAGFAGLAAATRLSDLGLSVTVIEKHATAGGRARMFESDGFKFDMGPSWYWMPDVFEQFFNTAGESVDKYLDLIRLDPSYKVWFDDGPVNIPASLGRVRALFESIEPGSGPAFDRFMKEAGEKYRLGMAEFVWKPGNSIWEFAKPEALFSAMNMSMFSSLSRHIRNHFSHPKIIQLLEFPVLFLGSRPENSPALYSLMNYADTALGTWYPMGGMYEIVRSMEMLARKKGVRFVLDTEVTGIVAKEGQVSNVTFTGGSIECDVVIAGADYHHVEQRLLPTPWRLYDNEYWESRKMSPGALIYYIGVDKRLPNLEHHNLFFDVPFEAHANAIYDNPGWPLDPLFYVAAPSKTDPSVAPEGCENLFILVPLAAGLQPHGNEYEVLFDNVISRLEQAVGSDIRSSIVFKRSYAHKDFQDDYNAFRGNAYGLANTMNQTAFMKPKMKSKLPGLFYAGQLTTPGPGVPPSLISGQVAAEEAFQWTSKTKISKTKKTEVAAL
jgi:phytoene desaturase